MLALRKVQIMAKMLEAVVETRRNHKTRKKPKNVFSFCFVGNVDIMFC